MVATGLRVSARNGDERYSIMLITPAALCDLSNNLGDQQTQSVLQIKQKHHTLLVDTKKLLEDNITE